MCIIIVFAHPTIRKKAYNFFWSTHCLYVVLYGLSLIHGLARLTGAPRFWLFFIGPGIIFTLDKVTRSFRPLDPLRILAIPGRESENAPHPA